MSWESVNQFLVKEHVGMFKAANNYDIFDLQSGQPILECREPNLGLVTKVFRFTDYKRFTPFAIRITDLDGNPVVEVTRGMAFLRSDVRVSDGNGTYLGGFKQKFFSIGGKFKVLDEDDAEVCQLNGSWTGWDFRFMAGDAQMARVSKKWSGMGKEFFTSADNYVLELSDDIPPGAPIRRLILAAVMCIDMVLKE